MQKVVILTIIVICVPVSVFSKTAIPKFDVDTLCARKSDVLSESKNYARGRCIEKEQRAYDRLEKEWETINEKFRDECVHNPNEDEKVTYKGLSRCLSRKAIDDEYKSKRFHP